MADVDYPILNLHVAEPTDKQDKQAVMDAAGNLRRQMRELEERALLEETFLADSTAGALAQTQELLSITRGLLGKPDK